MRIFLSYAAQQKSVAEPIAFSLRSRGHKVFLDRDDLPPGQSYEDQIEAAIGQSELFIFLISPESIAKGRFTQTELAWARAKWPAADRNVLPVMIAPVDLAEVPSYLKAVTILEPMGNVAAEVSAVVANLARAPDAGTLVPLLGLTGALAGLVSGGLSWVTPTHEGSGGNLLDLTVGSVIIQHQKYAPLYVPLLFTAGIYFALRRASTIRLQRWALMLLAVTVGWIAAVNIGFRLPNPFGFNMALGADQIAADTAEERERIVRALADFTARTKTFGLLFNGFVAGLVGAAFTALGFFASLSGPRRRFEAGHYIAVAVIGGLSGLLFHPELSLETMFGNWLPLFTVWQGTVAAALAYAVATSRTS